MLLKQSDRIFACPGLRGHFKIGLAFDDRDQAFPQHGMLLGLEYRDSLLKCLYLLNELLNLFTLGRDALGIA